MNIKSVAGWPLIQILCLGVILLMPKSLPGAAAEWPPLTVTDLKCEYRVNPLGIDAAQPRLSWQFVSDQRGQRQSAYRVLAADSLEALANGQGALWDSGRVESSQSVHVVYAGSPLAFHAKVWWKVMVWDASGNPTPWSEPAFWVMGILDEAEWGGDWIGATTERTLSPASGVNGYHAIEADSPDTVKWVQVDLGEPVAIDTVELTPARPNNFSPDTPGFGFPLRFKIEAGDDPSFENAAMIADLTGEDTPNPNTAEAQIFQAGGVKARYVRVTATRLYERPGDGKYCFALKALAVISGGENVARNAPVGALDSINRADWNSQSLTAAPGNDDSSDPADPGNAALLLRKEFKAGRHLASATASICGLGYYELFINGRRIGDHRLDPGWTDYEKRCLYVTYDVTDAIDAGSNAIGVRLGNGFFNQTTPDIWAFHQADWAAPATLRFQLRLVYDDGSVETVLSDDSWNWSTGEVVFQSIRSGETADMRRAKPGWNTADYKMDGEWRPVQIVSAPRGKLTPQNQPPIRAIREVGAIELTEPAPGVYVFKLAENITGWFRFQTRGETGQHLTFTCDERIHPDGSVHQMNNGFTFGRFQTDELILAGEGVETFEPHFTYHGFQYVQIDGLKERPAIGDLVGIKANTDLESAGRFSCSDDMLNTMHAMNRRTYLNDLHSIPTDCPHREKLGWLADGVISAYQACYNYDAAAFYTKWAEDMVDNQYEDGRISPVIPGCGWATEGVPPFDISWGGAIVMVPWIVYQQYGDTRLLADHYEAMKRYVDHTAQYMEDGLFTKFQLLGDWLEVDRASTGETAAPIGVSVRTPPVLANSASGYYSAWILARTAELLGKTDDAAHYDAFAADIARAINSKYLDIEKGTYGPDTQAGPAMALAMGFAPDGQHENILAALEDNIVNTSDGHISTGIVATHYLLKALFDNGQAELAYRMLKQPHNPGWGHMILMGSTTLWESWDGGSLNHPALGCYDTFFYSHLAGIQATEPGFASIRIRPEVLEGLTWVRAAYDSVRGTIVSNWRVEDGVLHMDVSIPPNTVATIHVPAQSAESVTESGSVAAGAEGIRLVGMDEGRAVFEASSGDYHFAAPRP